MSDDHLKGLEQLRKAFEIGAIDEETYQSTIDALKKTAGMKSEVSGAGAAAQNGGVASGQRGVSVGKHVEGTIQTGDGSIHAGGHIVYAREGATVLINEEPVKITAVDRQSDIGRYLNHIISQNRYLQLQGIRSGGRLVHIELDQIFINLRTTRERAFQREQEWLEQESSAAPGEISRLNEKFIGTETVTISVNEALADYLRLVILGDPGSGKTTLVRYLALVYARDLAEDTNLVGQKLGLDKERRLPITIPFRKIGAFLKVHRSADDGTEGFELLLEYLFSSLQSARITLADDFFDEWLSEGKALVLLDGLDEVPDPDLRRRISRLVEAFTAAYPECRYVVTSRIVGYTGASRLGEGYKIATVKDFSLSDVRRFVETWQRLVAIGQMGPGETSEAYAAQQSRRLLHAIESNDRIRELSINPLMLTVIAMVHRDRVKLPDRRAELYAEAIEVLLGKWEDAKGMEELPVLEEKPFDTGDKRLMLQSVAYWMHQNQQKEIASEVLKKHLKDLFDRILGDPHEAERSVKRFIDTIEQRTGLLTARGEGVYTFSHLTFQEYLAALALAANDDYVPRTLERVPDKWWREVILLEAGYLSMQSKERTMRLIRGIADHKVEPEPFHNLVLAADCLRDVGSNRVDGELEKGLRMRLQSELEFKPPRGWLGSIRVRVTRGMNAQEFAIRRRTAAEALARIGGKAYWTLPCGEPEWVKIPPGEFLMGDGDDSHKVHLEGFCIARVPITNAQYDLFVKSSDYAAPRHWEDGKPPKGKESHPVTYVSFRDALSYCKWLGQKTGKPITLPSEAEWEKSSRGHSDQRVYPWGDEFDPTKCNCVELGLMDTTPVGIFPEGASPYGVLDMSGNVWEWTRSLWGEDLLTPDFKYPYKADTREDLNAPENINRVLRGGAFDFNARDVRCASRHWGDPDYRSYFVGFRVVLAPKSPSVL